MSEQDLSPEPAPAAIPVNQPLTLHGPWLWAARALWLGLALLTMAFLVVLATRGERLLLLEDEVSDSYAALAKWMEYPTYTRLVLGTRYTTLSIYLLTAFFIFWRRSNEVIGLITSLMLLLLPMLYNLGGVIPDTYLTVYYQRADIFLGNYWNLALAGLLAVVLFLFLFPTGRFPSRWARTLLWAGLTLGLLAAIVPAILPETADESLGYLVGLTSLVIMLPGGMISQIYRYARVSGPAERTQTRLVLAALALVLIWTLAVYIRTPFRSFEPWAGPWALFKIFGTVIVLSLVPLSIARAILRYHLWDIDVIVRKTLVYTLLTGSLALVYFASIVVLQRLLAPLTGDSTLATILSTLLIAALFLPVRRQIQGIIDRRFFRRKYNAEQVLADFAATARDETDLDALTAELLRVIQETMQPEHVSVWLKPIPDSHRPNMDEATAIVRGRDSL